jgi:type I protein arginine methyltransferase
LEYSIPDYGRMIADVVRMDAYASALERVVTPGSVVLDIGTGTGIAALLAVRLGARRVFAVDPSPVIQVAREVARENGYADRIEFFERSAIGLELPEQADVAVSDLRGILPHHRLHLEVLENARQRLLKPGGALIPARDTLWAAPVEAPRAFAEHLGVWRKYARGLNLNAARSYVTNEWVGVSLKAGALISEPRVIGSLEYAAGRTGDLDGSMTFTTSRVGVLHGLCVWFDTELIEGIGFSNAPGSHPKSIYGQAFFPLTSSVRIPEGEEVTVHLAANLVARHYIYRWNVRVGSTAAPRARFRQSTFAGFPLSARALHAADENHRPSLGKDGRVAQRILELMGEGRSVAEIADAIEAESGSHGEALGLATGFSQKYGAR